MAFFGVILGRDRAVFDAECGPPAILFRELGVSRHGSGNQGEGNGGGSGGEEGEGNGSGQGNGSGGGWSDSNNIIDGETPYRDVLEQYLEAMREQIANGTLPQELIDFIESYFNGL